MQVLNNLFVKQHYKPNRACAMHGGFAIGVLRIRAHKCPTGNEASWPVICAMISGNCPSMASTWLYC